MTTPDDTSDQQNSGNQETVEQKPPGSWPFGRSDGYENPSLERYTDLRFGDQPRGHRKWVVTIAALLALGAVIVLGFMIAIYAEARGDETRNADAIVILGAAQFNGRPSDVFAARLEHGLTLYNEGYAPWIIVTGGKQDGDSFTEADTAEAWLIDRGVPEEAILKEAASRDTWANLEGAKEAAELHEIETVLIVSDGFHLFRAERIADAVGFEAYSSPAPTSPIRPWSGVEFGYVIRETAAVIVQMPRWLF